MSKLDVKRVNRILAMLFDDMRTFSDEERDLPIRWSVMHMYSSSQVAKLIALRRGMDMELASVAAALHDIAVIISKKTEDHAEKSEEYVRAMIAKYNNQWSHKLPIITLEEENILVTAIKQHSDKETYSEDAFVELLKDIDSVDRYLHGIQSEGAYIERCNRVFAELGIPTVN